jgi:hypothetical protein
LFSKNHASTAWAASDSKKPVLSSFILSFFIRFCQRETCVADGLFFMLADGGMSTITDILCSAVLRGEMVEAPDFSPGKPAIEKRALALVIPLRG